MAKRIKQFYFKSDSNASNRPSATKEEYVEGTVFDSVFPISQLGIQGLPGT